MKKGRLDSSSEGQRQMEDSNYGENVRRLWGKRSTVETEKRT